MSDTATPTPPTLAPPPSDEPLTSVQSQIGLFVVAVFTVIAFIFHKDFSSIVPAVTTLALASYGAAVAIARAIKHRTIVQATMYHNQQRLDAWATSQQQSNLRNIDARLRAVEAAPAATSTARTQATVAPKKTTRARARR